MAQFVDDLALVGHLGGGHAQTDRCMFYEYGRHLAMSKPLAFPALSQLVAATTGRNMTGAAYVAVTTGVVMMLVLTVVPPSEAAHRWIELVLWCCLVFFIFEWVVRLRNAHLTQRGLSYALSGRGLVDALGAMAIPLALVLGADPSSAWLLSVFWVSLLFLVTADWSESTFLVRASTSLFLALSCLAVIPK